MMSEALKVAAEPCSTCPYRKDTPPGIWHQSEYEKLRAFDTNESIAAFLCHQSTATGEPTACRGWLTVHRESVSVRLAMMHGKVTREQVYASTKTPMYATGEKAADAGCSGLKRPSADAVRKARTLLTRGIGTP
jgi:hypothetical protein